jgi:hypothetical protein
MCILKPEPSNSPSQEWIEAAGAGTNRDDAIHQAADNLVEQHPELLDSI